MPERTKVDRLIDWLREPPSAPLERLEMTPPASVVADAFEELRDQQQIMVLALDHLAGPGGAESDLRLWIELLEERVQNLEQRCTEEGK